MCEIGQEFYPGEDWFEWLARHRVDRVCVECPFPIRAGEKHVVVFHGPYEGERAGEWHRFFCHRACDRLKDFAAKVVCGDSAPFGELLTHVEWCEVALIHRALDPDDEAAAESFAEEWPDFFEYDVDEDQAADVVRRWEAIEHRYDGIERDLGGEG